MGRGYSDQQRHAVSATSARTVVGASAIEDRPQFTVVGEADRTSDLARIVVKIVQMAGCPVDPDLLDPVALILQRACLIKADGVTFGCDYDLNVRSIELARGYIHAIDVSWLRREKQMVTVSPHARMPLAAIDARASEFARELFSLDRATLLARARPLLLAE